MRFTLLILLIYGASCIVAKSENGELDILKKNVIQRHRRVVDSNYLREICEPLVREMPHFTGRVSKKKCQEFIWDLKFEDQRRSNEETCQIMRLHEKRRKDGLNYGGLNGEIFFGPSVVRGRNTFAGEFPHMGAIGWKGVDESWTFKCGCSLISSKFVLTAAHCSSASTTDKSLADPNPKIVRFMAKNLDHSPKRSDVNISRVIIHPRYRSPQKYYDIALMELEREVGFNDLVQPACLWTKPDLTETDMKAVITGWGVLKENSQAMSEELQAAAVNLFSHDNCSALYNNICHRHWCGVRGHQLCAGNIKGGVDACQGDSGGPLQVKMDFPRELAFNIYKIIGVTSFGIGCARIGMPGIYTRVTSFLDWLEPIVWPST